MEVDYKALFEIDATPKLIIARKQEAYFCISANQKAREFFHSKDFKKTLPLNDILPNIHFDGGVSKIAYDHEYDIQIQTVGAGQEIFELSFVRPRQKSWQEKDILTAVFDSSDVGIIITNKEGNVVRINKGFSRLFGWQPEDVIGATFHKFIAEEDRDRASQNHKRFLQRGVRSTGEVRFLNKNNTVSDTLSTLTALSMEDGEKMQITTVIDITFRKRMEKSLREAKELAESSNRAKSSFLANMSHELRTPLNAIIGFSEMLISQLYGPLGDPKYSEYTKDIHNSACHLLEIINEILDMSRIEAGSVKLAQNEAPLPDLVDTVQRMLSPYLQEKDIAIEQKMPEAVPVLRVDSRLMRQAFINILTNAVKYSGNGTTVKVQAHYNRKEDLSITIKDQGQGIPQDKLAHVLKPFGRVEDAFRKKSDVEGTGLGLPIAKGMIELHGGSLSIESEEGKGTTVEIIIPSYRVVKKPSSSSFADFKFDPIATQKAAGNTTLAQ